MERNVLVTRVEQTVGKFPKLNFWNNDGEEFSINDKRKQLWPVIQKDRLVKLTILTYTNPQGKAVDYINDAVLAPIPGVIPTQPKPTKPTEELFTDKKPAATVTANQHTTSTTIKPSVSPSTRMEAEDIKIRSMAISYSKDLCCNGCQGIEELIPMADTILAWIQNG